MKRDKRQRFVIVAERRMRRTLRDLRLLANLSNRSAYDYSAKDISAILSALDESMATLRVIFRREAQRGEINFKL